MDVALKKQDYKYGFVTPITSESLKKGLNEETIHAISHKKKEPEFLLQYRLKAFKTWQKMKEPRWAYLQYPPIDYQNMSYFSTPKKQSLSPQSLKDVDPELIKTFERLGIPLMEQKRLTGVAIDAVFDSVSIGTTHQKELEASGVIFCSFSEAVTKYPEMIEKYLGKVVPIGDNFFSTLNAAVFSDGSFCYIPKNVRCPMDLSTYFRINAKDTGQFERTLLIAEEGSFVNYLED